MLIEVQHVLNRGVNKNYISGIKISKHEKIIIDSKLAQCDASMHNVIYYQTII